MFISYVTDKSLKKVLNGKFPKKHISKLNRKHLESFVLKLVECSSGVETKIAKSFAGLYRSFCLREVNKPEWWPNEQIIEQSLTPDGKYFMELLRFLVYKCSEFFKKPWKDHNQNIFFYDNDENSREENCSKSKRKLSIPNKEVPSKRRTLMPKNPEKKIGLSKSNTFSSVNNGITKNSIIQLKDIFYQFKPEPLKQHDFLKNLDLRSKFNNNIEEVPVPTSTMPSIKFNSCSVIPFSSDLGRELFKKSNYVFPESLKIRRLERLEWYVNQPVPPYSNINFEVTYHEKRDLTLHNFKFPRRNIWQHPGDVEYQKKILICKPLKIILIRNNLEAMKHKMNQISGPQLKVVLSKMSMHFAKSHVKKRRSVKLQRRHKAL